MRNLHFFGLTIITLVIAAFLNTPTFFAGLTVSTKLEIITLIVFLILIAVTTLVRLLNKQNRMPSWLPITFGCVLFITSGYMFFGNTAYFWHGINLPMPFWHRVSFYTLPAISLESAIVVGFEYIMNKASNLSVSEKKPIRVLFFFYTLTTMAINFMAIGRIIEVSLHVSIARIILISSIAIVLAVLKAHLIKKTV